ncbi:unnamed protein product [Lactuca saligna]|uniref:Uncharacterized protein n=1 Tax=Lactuca saligna TaxID=75948 RepID=A0AA36DZN1_LACSI|nr:unnamed protein product [Lactuca saligna]
MAEDDTPVDEAQYNGTFINKPFIYFDLDKKEIMYVDFREKGYTEFIAHLNVITRRMCKDVYYYKECWEHEVDDEDVSMKRATTTIQKKDRFLNKLCPNVEKEEDSNVEQLPPVYHVHNSEQQWDEMSPVLGININK